MKHKLERRLLFPVIVLCALLVAACSPAATQTTSTEGGMPPKADGQPQKGGTLRIMGGGYVSYGTTDSHRAAFGPPKASPVSLLTRWYGGISTQVIMRSFRTLPKAGRYLRMVSLIPSSCIKA